MNFNLLLWDFHIINVMKNELYCYVHMSAIIMWLSSSGNDEIS